MIRYIFIVNSKDYLLFRQIENPPSVFFNINYFNSRIQFYQFGIERRLCYDKIRKRKESSYENHSSENHWLALGMPGHE